MAGALSLSGLVKRFGDEVAVDGLDLEIGEGEFFSLLGSSGCGKTTTLRMIAGFERPDEGRIELDGVDLSQVAPHKRPVNTVFQSYALFPFLDVAENVGFGLRYQRATKEEVRRRVGAALDLVQMGAAVQAQAPPALRRPAAAGRAGARPRARADRAPARRADGRPRRQAPQAAPARPPLAAEAGRHDVRLRHPRPGRGAHDERPAGRARPRPGDAGRHAERGLQRSAEHPRRDVPRHHQPLGGRGALGRRRRAAAAGSARSTCASTAAARARARPSR